MSLLRSAIGNFRALRALEGASPVISAAIDAAIALVILADVLGLALAVTS